jgi:hypothetical protein
VNSVLEHGLIELRALNLVVLIEYLTGRYAYHHNKVLFLKQSRFDEEKKELQKRLRDILEKCFQEEDLMIKSEQLRIVSNDMANKVEELNRRSFNTVLKQLVSSLHLEIDEEERRKFISIRNALVYLGRFLNQEKNTEDSQKQFLSMGLLPVV